MPSYEDSIIFTMLSTEDSISVCHLLKIFSILTHMLSIENGICFDVMMSAKY